jgi:hypothetical protein
MQKQIQSPIATALVLAMFLSCSSANEQIKTPPLPEQEGLIDIPGDDLRKGASLAPEEVIGACKSIVEQTKAIIVKHHIAFCTTGVVTGLQSKGATADQDTCEKAVKECAERLDDAINAIGKQFNCEKSPSQMVNCEANVNQLEHCWGEHIKLAEGVFSAMEGITCASTFEDVKALNVSTFPPPCASEIKQTCPHFE